MFIPILINNFTTSQFYTIPLQMSSNSVPFCTNRCPRQLQFTRQLHGFSDGFRADALARQKSRHLPLLCKVCLRRIVTLFGKPHLRERKFVRSIPLFCRFCKCCFYFIPRNASCDQILFQHAFALFSRLINDVILCKLQVIHIMIGFYISERAVDAFLRITALF